MIWLAIIGLALAALSPLAVSVVRRGPPRGPRALAMELHRAQLAELDRDLADARILPAEHKIAVLEVQRRLLAAAGEPEPAARPGSAFPLVFAAILVPTAALALYLVGGTPDMPSVTEQAAVARSRAAADAAMLDRARARLATLDPMSDQARQGYVLLGNLEEQRGSFRAAADAWGRALAARFDPALAVRTSFAMARAEGGLTTEGAALLRRALAAAPADVPWRGAAEQVLKQAGL